MKEPCEPQKSATVLRTIRSNLGLNGFMHFSRIEVLKVKRTEIGRSSQLTGSDRTVRPKFKNLDENDNINERHEERDAAGME